MEGETFLNKQVAELVELTGRQILSWTEKGLINAYEESPGVGIKRKYDYINLLEFALSRTLLDMGLGFRTTKLVISDLRGKGAIKSWATDFSDYYEDHFKKSKTDLHKVISELKKEGRSTLYLEEAAKHLKEPFKQEKPTGVLIYFFGNEESTVIIPWGIDSVLNLYILKKKLTGNLGFILVDIGKIKGIIDRKL